jgi:hypothetical protein
MNSWVLPSEDKYKSSRYICILELVIDNTSLNLEAQISESLLIGDCPVFINDLR